MNDIIYDKSRMKGEISVIVKTFSIEKEKCTAYPMRRTPSAYLIFHKKLPPDASPLGVERKETSSERYEFS